MKCARNCIKGIKIKKDNVKKAGRKYHVRYIDNYNSSGTGSMDFGETVEQVIRE